MATARPYHPKTKRDPLVGEVFWEGVYYGLACGLLAGGGVWVFVMLGGAPVAASRGHAALTLAGCGLFGLLAVSSWVWGARGLELTAPGLVTAAGLRLEWLLWPFIPESADQDRGERVGAAARRLARALLALPAGLAVMIALGASGQVRPLRGGPLAALSALALILWLGVAVQGAHALLGPRRVPAPARPAVDLAAAERLRQERVAAETDSALQLAVAKAKRAKARGEDLLAISTLETALNDAHIEGRSVAHLELHRQLGWLYARQGNVPLAAVMFETVLRLAEPGSPQAREATATLARLHDRAAVEHAGGAPPASPAPPGLVPQQPAARRGPPPAKTPAGKH